jgi:hypothetical protein
MVEIKSQKELRNIGCVGTKTLLTRTSKKKTGKIGWRSGTFPQKKTWMYKQIRKACIPINQTKKHRSEIRNKLAQTVLMGYWLLDFSLKEIWVSTNAYLLETENGTYQNS